MPTHPSLSPRESQVLWMLGSGLTTKQMGLELKISFKTVETFRENIKEKIGLANSFQLTVFAVRWVVAHELKLANPVWFAQCAFGGQYEP